MRTTINVDDIDWNNAEKEAKRLGFTSRNELVGYLLKSQLDSENKNRELTTKQKIEDAKLKLFLKKYEILEQDLRIKTSFAEYVEKYVKEFGTFPSYRGMKALSTKAKNDNVIKVTENQKEEWIPKFATTFSQGKFFGLCKICHESDFESVKEDFLIERLEDHIKDTHGTEPYTRVIAN